MSVAILAVDDEQDFLDSVHRMLRIEGHDDVTAVTDPTAVAPLLEQKAFDIAFLDITMPEMDGLDLLALIKEHSPQTECIMVTAHESVPLVVEAIRRGAYDYLVKPISPDQMIGALTRALERRRLLQTLLLRSEAAVTEALDNPEAFAAITTGNHRVIRLLHEAELHAGSEIPILVTGETGVGKELLARAIHGASRRATGPFVPVNMLALSPTLFESEVFGHAKGAFTGADREKTGYLAQARGGTLFLDEIGDLSLEIQGKLLRILQEGEFVPVGKTKAEQADARFVAATNQDLSRLVQQRKFRKDLFYRLQFAHMHLPPLRERRDDIPLLAKQILSNDASISTDALDALASHSWPGNVRELKGVLEAAANLARGGEILSEHLRLPAKPAARAAPRSTSDGPIETLAQVERRHILAIYERLAGNKTQTAKALEIGLQTLHRKLKTYGVK